MKQQSSSTAVRQVLQVALATTTALATAGAQAQGASTLAPTVAMPVLESHQLWVANGLFGLVAGLVAFVAARSWPLAGIVLVAALWYVLPQLAGPALPAEALRQLGERYPFHVQASALLVPLMVLAGIGARRSGLADRFGVF